jgi:uncharacterized protein (DUF1778 family)
MTSLEGFMLKNDTEPIQQNLSDRVARIVGRTPEERKAIAQNVKKAYGLRSALLHHAAKIQEKDTLKEFMLNAWGLFIELLRNPGNFKTRDEFLSAVDDAKYA